MQSWFIYAFLGALAAALTTLCIKIGLKDINSDFATALRGIVSAVFLVILTYSMKVWPRFSTLNGRHVLFIVVSGVLGAMSWYYGYKALQMSTVSKTYPIDKLSLPMAVILAAVFLGEGREMRWQNWIGIVLISVGTWLAVSKFVVAGK